MTLFDTLNTIRVAGGRVWVEAGAIRLSAPTGVITEEHKAVIAAHKSVLLGLLAEPDRVTTTSTVEVLEPIEGDLIWFETLPTPFQDRHLDQTLTEWRQLVGTPAGIGGNDTGGNLAGRLIPVRTKVPTEWRDGSDKFTVAAGSRGWACLDPEAEISDPWLRRIIVDTLARKMKQRIPSVAVWLCGRPRVLPMSMVRIGDAG